MRQAVVGLLVLVAAAPATTVPVSPIAVRHLVGHNPDESIFQVVIDLTDPRVSLHVAAAGSNPDGGGPWQTTLLPTSEIAARERWAVAVNGDFFEAQNTRDVEGRATDFVRGKWARPLGPTVCDGHVLGPSATTRPTLEVAVDGHADIAVVNGGAVLPAGVRQAIGGSSLLVRDGRPVGQTTRFALAVHPRTAVGVTRDGRHLILVVVDGRQPGRSLGMTFAQLADVMVDAGAFVALNLDGGGSTTLVCRDPATARLRVVNAPSDGTERAVADVIGVRFEGPLPPLP